MKRKMLALMVLWPGLLLAEGDIAKSLRASWQATRTRIMGLAEAMPEEKFDFKATPEQMTFAQQLAHLTEANFFLMHAVAGTKAPEAAHPSKRDEILKALADSFDFGDATLAGLSDKAALETVKLRGNEITKLRVAIQTMTNCFDHYGQMVVYLRLNGIVPPASRPTKK